MNILQLYGWEAYRESLSITIPEGLTPARIISIKGFKYYAVADDGELEAELSGKLLYGAESEELPKVGDWVALMRYDTLGYIIEVLPRSNALSRKTPGAQTQRQILATNVDAALVVQGLDRDFNVMRLERYLVQLQACGIAPVVILNKADLVDDPNVFLQDVERLQRDVPVHLCSTLSRLGMDDLRHTVLKPQRTYIMIGSSGVGKSSLLNALLPGVVQTTGATSDANHKGKHTTTTRDLFRLPNGSLLIDTPGMREFGVTAEEGQGTDDLFPAIQRAAQGCKFSDCDHIDAAGCAVIAAVQQGDLDPDLYDSYLKLKKEQRRFEIRIEDKKRLGKQFGKLTREAKNYRKKYKF
ncbi:ribosome small subunit-dependent GTPase A [Chryseolinea lacunae]|uniref:Small ribosomal subunit biogenesis GTPase RsgA n=1 Tax=Chryseolinea lacunae TaxID=2801331 RepID=A0ABS1L0M7_9BACT|nr:ribosome small subunit-dependent GTPase A [Chryseolinea lacunae]MBL0745073.1 ribosome small subunit-dependent GTPase A [Chryseolinea lacunae]